MGFETNLSRMDETNQSADGGKRIDPQGFVDGLQAVRMARATYDFPEHGGVVGAIGLGVTLPAGSVIEKAWIVNVTDPTSGGSATLAINTEGAGDILAALAVASFTGILAGIPVGTTATMIQCTVAREIVLTVAVADLTAGRFHVYVKYAVNDVA